MDLDRHKRVDVRLKRALESRTLPRELLICGPAGTGKTYGLLLLLHLLADGYPGLRILVCRKERVALTESVLVTYERDILGPDSMGSLAAGANRKFRSSYRYPNGSEFVLAGADDTDRVGSTDWDIIYVNEGIQLEEAMMEVLTSRLRRPGSDPRFGFFLSDTNPGHPAHWLKKRCDEGLTKLWDTTHYANPRLWDGKGWTPEGIRYRDQLDHLRGVRRKRLLEGVWAAGEGQWFETFGEQHVSIQAEYDPRLDVWLAVDSGYETGAVWFQVRESGREPLVTVFGDFYANARSAYEMALAIRTRSAELCGGRIHHGYTDPAGAAHNPFGSTVVAEYARAGLHLDLWPRQSSVANGLALIESFVSCDPPGLLVHPRCEHLISAFANYIRAKRGGQYLDSPIDPQHPQEELMDSLRGGLTAKYPEGRRPEPVRRWVSAPGGRLR